MSLTDKKALSSEAIPNRISHMRNADHEAATARSKQQYQILLVRIACTAAHPSHRGASAGRPHKEPQIRPQLSQPAHWPRLASLDMPRTLVLCSWAF